MRGSVQKRGRDSYCIVLELGRDENGKRKQKRISGFTRKADAEKELTKQLAEIDKGIWVEPSTQSTGTYLDYWLNDVAKPSVAPSTYAGYRTCLKVYLWEHIKAVPLRKLRAQHIQSAYNKVIESGRSHRTVHNAHRVLSKALHDAVRAGTLPSNPCAGVTPPKYTKKETRTLTAQEALQLLEKSSESIFFVPFHLALYTGMRRGEIIALRWPDVDFEHRRIAVTKSEQYIKKQFAVFPPKNGKSRNIAISKDTAKLLRSWKKECAARQLALGDQYVKSDYICVHEDGSRIKPDLLTRKFPEILKECDLEGVRFHDQRHTMATLMLKAGVPVKVVSEMLGHSTTAITNDLYTHAIPQLEEDAAEKLSGIIRTAPKKKEEDKKVVTNM